jgi:hypothetical protein
VFLGLPWRILPLMLSEILIGFICLQFKHHILTVFEMDSGWESGVEMPSVTLKIEIDPPLDIVIDIM